MAKTLHSIQLHASCVSFSGKAVLLLGESGSGKSDVALRLIDQGAMLVSDDQVIITISPPLEGGVLSAHFEVSNIPPTPTLPFRGGGSLFVSPPSRIQGMLEVRGVGILRMPYVEKIPLVLAVSLVAREEVVRHPALAFFDCLGLQVPLLSLHAFDSSTPAKIRIFISSL